MFVLEDRPKMLEDRRCRDVFVLEDMSKMEGDVCS